MNIPDFILRLRARLAQPLPGREAQERMAGRVRPMPDEAPDTVRHAAVLMALYPHEGRLTLLAIRRSRDHGAHSGQIAFPGGRWEPADADLRVTALRETEEEVGIPPKIVDVLGALTPLYIPVSNFTVHPFVGSISERPALDNLSATEVAGILEVPVEVLFHPGTKKEVTVRPHAAPGLVLNVPAYVPAEDAIMWGATAMMLSELEAVFPHFPPQP